MGGYERGILERLSCTNAKNHYFVKHAIVKRISLHSSGTLHKNCCFSTVHLEMIEFCFMYVLHSVPAFWESGL